MTNTLKTPENEARLEQWLDSCPQDCCNLIYVAMIYSKDDESETIEGGSLSSKMKLHNFSLNQTLESLMQIEDDLRGMAKKAIVKRLGINLDEYEEEDEE